MLCASQQRMLVSGEISSDLRLRAVHLEITLKPEIQTG